MCTIHGVLMRQCATLFHKNLHKQNRFCSIYTVGTNENSISKMHIGLKCRLNGTPQSNSVEINVNIFNRWIDGK